MKYLAILLLLALPDSLIVKVKLDTVQQKEVHKQAQQTSAGVNDLSTKFDSLLIFLQNDTLRKKN